MPGQNPTFSTEKYYHITNWGIENRLVFTDKKDIDRFTSLLDYYQIKNPPARFAFRKKPIVRNSTITPIPMVEIVAYTIMPTSYHLLLRQLTHKGVSTFMSKISNGYTRFYNARHKRQGPLFKGTFQAKEVKPEQLDQVSRYIHLKPITTELVRNLANFPFSSYKEYTTQAEGICEKKDILDHFTHGKSYTGFVLDTEDYKNKLPEIQNCIFEYNT